MVYSHKIVRDNKNLNRFTNNRHSRRLNHAIHPMFQGQFFYLFDINPLKASVEQLFIKPHYRLFCFLFQSNAENYL